MWFWFVCSLWSVMVSIFSWIFFSHLDFFLCKSSFHFICSFLHWVIDFLGSLVFWAPCIFWLSVPFLKYSSQRFSPIRWVVCLIWRPLLLLCRSFLISCSLICWSFPLVAGPIEFYWGSHCLCLLLPVNSLLFPVLASRFQVLYKGPSSTLNWYLYRVANMDLVSIFYKQIPNFPSNICWRDCFSSLRFFWHLCQSLGGCRCVNSYLGLPFCSTGFHMFWNSTTLFL
jgi:hypothetical protein